MQIRIYYEDTDTGGIVYHSNYLNFCERARSEVFFSRGLNPVLENGHFVVKKLEANFIASAKLGDIIEVKNELISLKGASFTLRQTIYKENIKLFVLDVILVFVSFDGKIQRVDKQTTQLLQELFG